MSSLETLNSIINLANSVIPKLGDIAVDSTGITQSDTFKCIGILNEITVQLEALKSEIQFNLKREDNLMHRWHDSTQEVKALTAKVSFLESQMEKSINQLIDEAREYYNG